MGDSKKPFMPFADIPDNILVIDITFSDGSISRQHFCYSYVFENGTLTLFKDIAHKYKEIFENVSKIEGIAI